jgi:hypothetical protein
VLSASVSDCVVSDGGLPFSGISWGWLHTRGAIAWPGWISSLFILIIINVLAS